MRIKRSIVTVQPTSEPVTVDEFALQAKLDSTTDENDLIEMYITAGRELIEDRIGQSLMTQTRQIKLDHFPRCGYIELLYGPVQSVVITYTDADGNPQTLNAAEYWFDTRRVTVKNYWPSTYTMPNAVTITYVAGFTAVPGRLKTAVLMRATHLYENRQSVTANNNYEVPLGEDDLIEQFIVVQDAFY